ncbi:hypothetical protein Egran_01069 [Elaphomyces granulatus]|uniref:Mitochondrial glyco protein n=1 Tax=Elaphomyces granulatus TaxID=519963 RepID=A0A232M458_9EURO|nr:hypothetical protein Egran_01069 [Elaphomyces granulatus]
MLSLRTFSRCLPRTVSRPLNTFANRPTTFRSLSTRIQKPSLLVSSWKPVSRQSCSAFFSTGRALREPAGDGDVELLAKFEEELRHEEESGLEGLESSVENIKYVVENGPWEVRDIPGEQEVVFSRKFGNENIRVTFSVADLQNIGGESQEVDSALSDEMEYPQREPSNANPDQPSQRNVATNPDDSAAPADGGFGDDMEDSSFPVVVNLTIEKPGSGVLSVQAAVQDCVFEIEEVSYFSQPDLALTKTAEKDWARQSLYSGPPFGNLDEDLQSYFERYLEERGVDTELANVIQDYIQVKEQKEYVHWLQNVKKFIAA